MTNDIAKIAKGLSKAQREAVLNMKRMFSNQHFCGSPSALHALKRKGISEGRFADIPTKLGLAIRAYLQENQP